MKRFFVSLCAVALLSGCATAVKSSAADEPIRNIIFMIGDGMGLSQVSAYMIEGGYEPTAFDRSDNVALIKTYSSNNRITDSAAAGTALACGVKTNNGMLGVTPQLDTLVSMTDRAKAAGMATGVVVSCTIQHATPAAFYANVDSRKSYEEITRQLPEANFDIIVGGGAEYFEQEVEGRSFMEIVEEDGFTVVRNFEELEAQKGEAKIIGLFEDGHIKSMAEGRGDYLTKATNIALEKLSQSEDGFVLMVEGSQIDWECHGNNAVGTLAETADFDRCLHAVMDFADLHPGTLVVITADHETGGLTIVNSSDDFTAADSGVEYAFSTGEHSATLVPVYLYGTGADRISGVMENTELSKRMVELLGL